MSYDTDFYPIDFTVTPKIILKCLECEELTFYCTPKFKIICKFYFCSYTVNLHSCKRNDTALFKESNTKICNYIYKREHIYIKKPQSK